MEGRGADCSNSDLAPGRFVATGWLSEVDTPGEWFLDKINNTLYVFPPAGKEPSASTRLGAWSAGTFLHLQDTAYVTVRDMEVLAVADSRAQAMVVVEGGHHNTVGGCTLRSSSRPAIRLVRGRSNRILGNDVYDVNIHLQSGDVYAPSSANASNLIATNNLIANNHFTQRSLRSLYGGIAVRGVGDRFSHNLVHDTPGQIITPRGPLLLMDHNEIFNTGYSEGDGGAMYSTQNLEGGYGMIVEHNFLHHLMEIPGLHGRGGIYFDQRFQGLINVTHNVMYKATGRPFLINGGGNARITENLIVNSGAAIFNQDYEWASDKALQDSLAEYDVGKKKRGDVGDYVWRLEQAVGASNFEQLFNSKLAQRFPSFARNLAVNSTATGWGSCAESRYNSNLFLNNSHRFQFASPNGKVVTTYYDEEALEKGACMDATASVDASWDWFPDADNLKFASPEFSLDTAAAGLQCDGWRRRLPDAGAYRPWVLKTFKGLPSSSPAGAAYTREAAALRSGLRSGEALLGNYAVPCPMAGRADCSGAWTPWGECEVDGQRVERWTFAAPTMADMCAEEEGATRRVQCPATCLAFGGVPHPSNASVCCAASCGGSCGAEDCATSLPGIEACCSTRISESPRVCGEGGVSPPCNVRVADLWPKVLVV